MKLKVLAIGCGRDGTTSITSILSNIYKLNGHNNIRAVHECDNAEIYEAARIYLNNKEHSDLKSRISKWNHHIESGNGYAFILPVFKDVFGPNLKIIHLKRDKQEHIESLKNNLERGQYWGGYAPFRKHFKLNRITAVDFGEKTKSEWGSMSIEDKLSWYYDKTHETINHYSTIFEDYFLIKTHELNTSSKLAELTKFIDPSFSIYPDSVHLNSLSPYKLEGRSNSQKKTITDMWQHFDFEKAIQDENYSLKYFIDYKSRKFVLKNKIEFVDEIINLANQSLLTDNKNLSKPKLPKMKFNFNTGLIVKSINFYAQIRKRFTKK